MSYNPFTELFTVGLVNSDTKKITPCFTTPLKEIAMRFVEDLDYFCSNGLMFDSKEDNFTMAVCIDKDGNITYSKAINNLIRTENERMKRKERIAK